MTIQTTGQRLLGIQVGQLLAIARHVAGRKKSRPIHLIAQGFNACFVSLIAAALEPGLFASYTDYNPLTTLRHVINWPSRYEEMQSVFSFGLLEVADVPQIRNLMEGVEYRTPGRVVVPDQR